MEMSSDYTSQIIKIPSHAKKVWASTKSLHLGFRQSYTMPEGKVGFLNLALTEKSMQVKFDSIVCVYSFGLDI